MNIFITLLSVILLAAVILAAELLRTSRSHEMSDCDGLWADVSAPKNYDPVDRLFEEADFRLVAEQPALARRLSSSRRKAARLFLREVRTDFLKAWALCRILSPLSPDSTMALRLVRHWFVFHALYGAATLHTTLGSSAVTAPGELVRAVRALQSGAADLATQQGVSFSAGAA